MPQHKKVAVYIDLENLRYGLINHFGQEPDFKSLVEKAKKYGRPSVMRAYADFSEHPTYTKKDLAIAGIEAINVNVKRLRRPKAEQDHIVERIKNAADMILALDAISEAMDADTNEDSKIFLLVTGDLDYIKLVTQLRHRFGQYVVVCGVPGSISNDLVEAADKADHIDCQKPEPTEIELIKHHLVSMIHKGPAPLRYWTMNVIDQWANSPKNGIPGTPKEKRDALYGLLRDGVIEKRELDLTTVGKRGNTTAAYLVEAKAVETGYLKQETPSLEGVSQNAIAAL